MAPRDAWARGTGAIALAARGVVLRTEAGRARPVWRLVYELLARGVAGVLTAGRPGSSAYLASNVATGDPVYGLSDIDLVIVAADAGGVRRRWAALRAAVPPLGEVMPDLATYTPAELEDGAGASTMTRRRGAAYLGAVEARDERGLRERPRPCGAANDWRRLRGPERRPPARPPTAQATRVAAWLELQFWWREAMRGDLRPGDPHAAYLCVKLVAEAARAWLAVAHGTVPPTRTGALRETLRRLPEEAAALRRAVALRDELGRHPSAPWAELLPAFARLSGRTAAVLGRAAEAEGFEDVALGPVPADGAFPLLDWRGLVLPGLPDETVVLTGGDPGEPAALAAAVRAAGPRSYAGLRGHGLLVLASGGSWRSGFLRAVACSVTDPVSFALAAGQGVARFPRLAGWSAADVARRAVEEHRGWLEFAGEDGVLPGRAWLDGREDGAPPRRRTAAKLLTAARAAVLAESLADGAPELPADVPAIGAALVARHPSLGASAEEVAGAFAAGAEPGAAAVRALRAGVRALGVFGAQGAVPA